MKVLNHVKPDQTMNAVEIAYLINFYRGEQPILKREKTYRPEIANKIVENHAYEAVHFKKGYAFGDPVQYVRRGAVTSEISGRMTSNEMDGSTTDSADEMAAKAVSKEISKLNEYMQGESKAAIDAEVAESFYICGVGYKGILPDKSALHDEDESPFEMECLDPKTTFVVYSSRFGHKPLLGVQEIRLDDNTHLYCCYTDSHYYEVKNDEIVKTEAHSLGGIPIIEYQANTARMGAFEPVLPLMNTLNELASNRVDGVAQHIQSIMKFVNCEVEDDVVEKLSEMGAVMVRSVEPGLPADVQLMTAELNQDQTQTLVEYTYQTMLTIMGMPDRQGNNRTTGDTGQAVILRDGWGAAEAMARETELHFKKAEINFLKVALRICEHSRGLNLRYSDIDIKFTRNRTDNLLVKTQGLLNMMRAGIAPQVAISHCGMFSDPEQVYLDSIPTLVTPEFIDKGITKHQVNEHVDTT